MPWAFLNPWFWLGALAVAAPIWLHLRRRKEKRIVRFSAVRFLEDEPLAARQPVSLRNLILFLFRVAALLCVVAAFAWPYAHRADTRAVKESRVYILDNTLSHQAGEGFQKDREKILRELSSAGPDTQVAVVELTGAPRVTVPFSQNREQAKDQVRALTPSFERGPYLAAFRQAADLLANSLGARKRIIFLGDNQQNQWAENVTALPFLRGVQVDLPGSPEGSRPNLSLSEAQAQRVFVGDKSLINFNVKLNRVGDAGKAKVRVRANGQLVVDREVVLEANSMLLQAQWEADPTQSLRGVAEVEGAPDLLAGDNQAFFTVAPVIEGTVALLAQSPYLRIALSPEIMRGHWSARVVEPGNLAEEMKTGVRADVLCVESGYLQSADARALVSRYLEAGQGVILLLDRVTPAADGFLRELDFRVEGKIERGDPERFQFVASSHRIFHPFTSPDYGNLMEVSVRNYFKLSVERATPLIFSEQGNGLLFEATRQQGKLFVCAFGLDREHTSWPIHSTFIPFLDLLLRAARSEEAEPPKFEPGQTWALQAPPGVAAQEVVLSAGGRVMSQAAVERGRAQVRLPGQPGLYEVNFRGATNAPAQWISVNPSPKESELIYVDSPGALATWRVDEGKEAPRRITHAEVNLAAVLQQRYWWWMVLAGLLALMAETALLARPRQA